MAAANIACTLDSSVTSHGTLATPSSVAVSASRRSCRSLIITVAPSSTQRRAVADPIPLPAAAVTSTRLPARSE